jgi:hypothetical protein
MIKFIIGKKGNSAKAGWTHIQEICLENSICIHKSYMENSITVKE